MTVISQNLKITFKCKHRHKLSLTHLRKMSEVPEFYIKLRGFSFVILEMTLSIRDGPQESNFFSLPTQS